MPGTARHIVRAIAAGLMLFAVLMLPMSQLSIGHDGNLASHAAHHHVMAMTIAGQANQPCSDHCDFGGHGLACCVTACTIAPASLPPLVDSSPRYTIALVSYCAAIVSRLAGLAPDPALRPPERIG